MSEDKCIGSPWAWSIVGVYRVDVSVFGLPITMFFKVEQEKNVWASMLIRSRLSKSFLWLFWAVWASWLVSSPTDQAVQV